MASFPLSNNETIEFIYKVFTPFYTGLVSQTPGTDLTAWARNYLSPDGMTALEGYIQRNPNEPATVGAQFLTEVAQNVASNRDQFGTVIALYKYFEQFFLAPPLLDLVVEPGSRAIKNTHPVSGDFAIGVVHGLALVNSPLLTKTVYGDLPISNFSQYSGTNYYADISPASSSTVHTVTFSSVDYVNGLLAAAKWSGQGINITNITDSTGQVAYDIVPQGTA